MRNISEETQIRSDKYSLSYEGLKKNTNMDPDPDCGSGSLKKISHDLDLIYPQHVWKLQKDWMNGLGGVDEKKVRAEEENNKNNNNNN